MKTIHIQYRHFFAALALVLFAALAGGTRVAAVGFSYTNITDLAGGPGEGDAPVINDSGDIVFYDFETVGTVYIVYFYNRGTGNFLNVSSLPGAPPSAFFPKTNDAGNIVMMEPNPDRDLWLFEAATQNFTNISGLQGYPGNSGANDLGTVYEINDNNQVVFHSGDLNVGDIYVYDHATGGFENISDKPGGAGRGRGVGINNFGQVAYGGFPDIFAYDPSTGVTTNITDLPGGPGAGFDVFAINDFGDISIHRPDAVTFYDAGSSSFLDLSTLPGWPAGIASSSKNDLSNRGGISFWRDDIYFFEPLDQSFTQLNGNGVVPAGGLASTVNSQGEVAFVGGFNDVYLAVRTTPTTIDLPTIGEAFALHQNHPNPFNPATVIDYDVPIDAGAVSLVVFDVNGRRVRTLVANDAAPSQNRVSWDGRNDAGAQVSTGVYFYRLRAGGLTQTRKMMLIK